MDRRLKIATPSCGVLCVIRIVNISKRMGECVLYEKWVYGPSRRIWPMCWQRGVWFIEFIYIVCVVRHRGRKVVESVVVVDDEDGGGGSFPHLQL